MFLRQKLVLGNHCGMKTFMDHSSKRNDLKCMEFTPNPLQYHHTNMSDQMRTLERSTSFPPFAVIRTNVENLSRASNLHHESSQFSVLIFCFAIPQFCLAFFLKSMEPANEEKPKLQTKSSCRSPRSFSTHCFPFNAHFYPCSWFLRTFDEIPSKENLNFFQWAKSYYSVCQ